MSGQSANRPFRAIVMGVSAGAFDALTAVVAGLAADLAVPVLVVQHTRPESSQYTVKHLNDCSRVMVKEAETLERARPGVVYFAPPDYHLLVEDDETLTLSVEAKVNFARPAIDVLFETAADVYGRRLIGVILTGSNRDGAEGAKKIKSRGGTIVVQDPKGAYAPVMPAAAIEAAAPDYVLPLPEIAELLNRLTGASHA